MSKRLLSYDPLNGVSAWFEGDGQGGGVIGHTQDVSKILERNMNLQRCPEYKSQGIKESWMHFAHVPAISMMEISKKFHVDFSNKDDFAKIERILSSRDYCKLRTVDRI